jgi:hypothetical protein
VEKEDRKCLSSLHLFERLVKLETIVKVGAEKDKEALELAQRLLEERLKVLNELRSEVMQDRSQFVKKEAYDEYHKFVIGPILQRVDTIEARWALLLAGSGIIIVIIGAFLYSFLQHIGKG